MARRHSGRAAEPIPVLRQSCHRRARWANTIPMPLKNIVKSQNQKPSSARPTQLTANAEEAITAMDARVAMALTDDITELHFRR